ncbi:MAG: response regulator transcription factor [Candidatus Aphodomorpha sp.]
MPRILLAEDDPLIAGGLTDFLRGEGFLVDHAATQADALCSLSKRAYDLLLLDIALPDGSGFAVCAAAKASKSDLPVIFLTAADEEYSVVAGLDMGADDYVSKPFRPRELLSRIRSVLRRTGRLQSVLECGPVCIDVSRGTATKNGEELCLSALEYRLLLLLLTNRGAVLTRERLLSELWDAAGEFVNDNTLTVYIKRLRDKIEDDPQNPTVIRTVRGVGYRVATGAEE